MIRRVFAAIDISEPAREAATKYVSELQTEFPDLPVRWERPEKLHITVRFAGSLDGDQLRRFTERVSEAAAAVEPFRIRLSGTGAFVKRRGPSALWLGIEQTGDDPLGTIASKLGSERRPFQPHVTIARIKNVEKAKELIGTHRATGFSSEEFDVREIVVYESTLRQSGSVYSVLERIALRAE